jgi:hypothetical protein
MASSLGKMPMTSARRLISRFTRSSGVDLGPATYRDFVEQRA